MLGDRDGSSCAPAFTRFVAGELTALGYQVKLNDPYKGVELVRRYADRAAGRHSLQIEINKRLYLDDASKDPDGFARVQGDIGRLIEAVGGYVRDQLRPPTEP